MSIRQPLLQLGMWGQGHWPVVATPEQPSQRGSNHSWPFQMNFLSATPEHSLSQSSEGSKALLSSNLAGLSPGSNLPLIWTKEGQLHIPPC